MTVSLATEQKLTPLMEQYRSIKYRLPQDTILFFRLGDFYEMFFEDALRASEILNITLTGREGGEAGRIPMCGIPYHAFHTYVRTLLDQNLKVAVCEQIGDPKVSKGLVERKVTRIITPATFLDEEAKGTAPEYMAALISHEGECAVAYLELSTGEFCVRQIPEDRLLSELGLLCPKEVILPSLLSTRAELVGYLKETLRASLTVYEEWIFDAEESLRRLQETFHLSSPRSLPFAEHPLCVSASGAILYYLKDHFHAAIEHINLPKFFDTRSSMVLDRQTQRSLELLGSLSGRLGACLLDCLNQTRTPMGSRTLSHWLTHPLLDLEEIRRRQDTVSELTQLIALTHSLRTHLSGIKDVERTLSRLNTGLANAKDLLHIQTFLARLPEISRLLSTTHSTLLQELFLDLQPLPDVYQLIERSIVENPPLLLKEGGIIKDGFSKELDELRGVSHDGRSWLIAFEQKEIARTAIKSLRVRYSQVFGYTIEVSKSNLHLVPAEYIRKQTLSNAERFVVPELILWDQKMATAQERIAALEYALFDEIRGQVLSHLTLLQAMARAVGVLDVLQSLSLTAMQKLWVRPEVVDSTELIIRSGRHPIVEAMLPQGQFVANDTTLGTLEHQLIVLTGPNMAGKSTYIRQVALIVLLAQMGSFVPAKSAQIGLVDRIFTRIGASDDLAGGESTFMVEMVETANILHYASSRSLLILDEVGRGTSTFDGVSLAWAICEYLSQGSIRPRTLFATHYHELTQLAPAIPGIQNYSISVKESDGGIVFLRKVAQGGADRSYGIHVAHLAGIPQGVIDRAAWILQILEREHTNATALIEAQENPLTKTRPPEVIQESEETKAARHLLDELKRLAIDRLTPLDALNTLWKWQLRINNTAVQDGDSSSVFRLPYSANNEHGNHSRPS